MTHTEATSDIDVTMTGGVSEIGWIGGVDYCE